MREFRRESPATERVAGSRVRCDKQQEMSTKLSRDQVEQYQRDGYTVARSVLDQVEIARILELSLIHI